MANHCPRPRRLRSLPHLHSPHKQGPWRPICLSSRMRLMNRKKLRSTRGLYLVGKAHFQEQINRLAVERERGFAFPQQTLELEQVGTR
jgi:hypothetical protein